MTPDSFRNAFFQRMADPQQIAALFEHLPGVYFLVKDTEGRFVSANAATRDRLGVSSESELIGATDTDFCLFSQAQDFRRDDRQVLTTGKPLVNRLEAWQDRRGQLHWFLTTKLPVFDSAGCAIGVAAIIRLHEERRSSPAINDAAAIVKRLRNDLKRIRGTAELADAVGVSERTLHRRVQEAFATTPHELILRIRIEAVGERLVDSNDPIASIALDHGFCDQSSLTRHFRERMGITPKQFRQRFHAMRSI